MNSSGLMRAKRSTTCPRPSASPGRACCDQLRQELAFLRSTKPINFAFQPAGDMIEVRMPIEGGTLISRIDRKRVVIVTAPQFIGWSVGFSALLLITSYMPSCATRCAPSCSCHWAADAFGRGEDAPDFSPSGAAEVRRAARSLIQMRNRIRRYADQRTAMLAGVSHDLRTPLARLKLELALLPKEQDATAAKADISEMERMLDGYLAFARGEEGEQPVETDLAALAQEASSHIASRAQYELVAPAPGYHAPAPARPEAGDPQPRQQRRRLRQEGSRLGAARRRRSDRHGGR